MKRAAIALILTNLLVFSPANAGFGSRFLAQVGTVGVADLGVENPGLLPTNPFYFLKEWGRGIRRFFTFNPAAQADLELEFANDKAAELKKVEETRPNDLTAISNALKNYQSSQERLNDRFEDLDETSENPNVSKLLDKFATRALQHEKIFSELKEKFSDNEEINGLADGSIKRIEKSAATASFNDDPDSFAARFEKAARELKEKGVNNAHSSAIEMIEGVQNKVSKNTQESLKAIQEELQKELDEQLDEERINEEENLKNEKEKILNSFFEESVSKEISPEEKQSCPDIKIKLDELWKSFKSKSISDEDYNKQYESLKVESAGCLEEKKSE